MYQLLYGAIQKLPTSITASLSFIYPIVAVIVDRFVFHHNLNPILFIGGAMILLAAAGINLGWGEKRRAKTGELVYRHTLLPVVVENLRYFRFAADILNDTSGFDGLQNDDNI